MQNSSSALKVLPKPRFSVNENGVQRVLKVDRRENNLKVDHLYNNEKEVAVIAAVMDTDGKIYPLLAEIIQATDFYFVTHQCIWRVFEVLTEQGQEIDILSVSNTLHIKMPEQASDIIHALTTLTAAAPTIDLEHVEGWARVVADYATVRRLLVASDEILAMAMHPQASVDVEALIDASAKSLHRAVEGQRKSILSASVSGAVTQLREKLDYHEWHGVSGVFSGWRRFDEAINGFQPGEVTVIGGYSGTGKTTWLISLIMNWLTGFEFDEQIKQEPIPVSLFTLEMTQVEVVEMLTAMVSGIPRSVFRRGVLTGEQKEIFERASAVIEALPLYIYDKAFFSSEKRLTPSRHRRICKVLQDTAGCGITVLDGIWLMASDRHTFKRNDEVMSIMEGIQYTADQLKIPVIAMQQYKEDYATRMIAGGKKAKQPYQSDFGESKAVRENAQVLVGLHNPSHFKHDPMTAGYMYAHLFKNRNNGIVRKEPITFKFNAARSYYTEGL
jgi:replicative DNA helicase